jgi:Sulfotransferase family
MKAYDPVSPLVSLHIPKAGGTSLLHLLNEWFPNGRLIRHYRGPDGTLPDRHKFEGPICIHGHFNGAAGFGIPDYYPQAKQFITFLREPFDRFVSIWFFLNRLRNDNIPFAVSDIDSDFETFLRRRADEHSIGKNQFSFVHHFPEMASIENISKMLTERFVFVGIMERYHESLITLCGILGRRMSKLPHLNETVRPDNHYLKFRAFYEKRFSDEVEIYEAALKVNNAFHLRTES